MVVDIAIAETKDSRKAPPETAERGRAGGLEGGRVRAARLSAERRSEIAKKGAAARWSERPKA